MPMDPRSFVTITPLPLPTNVGLRVTARSSKPVYTCEYPTRKQVTRNNYDRRKYQRENCGYKSVNFRPYNSVGEVILDDKELILRGLGQSRQSQENNIQQEDVNVPEANEHSDDSETNTKVQKEVLIVPGDSNDTNLQSVYSQVSKGRRMINKVKLGIGLFKIIREEQEKKAAMQERERIHKEQEKRQNMRISAAYDSSDDESEVDLSRHLVSLPEKPSEISSDSGTEDELTWERPNQPHIAGVTNQLVTKQRSSSTTSIKSFINISRWQRIGSAVTSFNRAKPTRSSRGSSPVPSDGNNNTRSPSPIMSPNPIIEIEAAGVPDPTQISVQHGRQSTGLLDPLSLHSQINLSRRSSRSSTGRSAASSLSVQKANSKKFKKSLPRPYSPIHTNINFYETTSLKHTFRQLCVVNWILEAMSQDQQPAIMPPISTCWTLRDLKEDSRTMKKKVEREKAVDPIWRSFLSNPNRFSQGRSGRRSTLYQRRVSVAPNVLLKLSASRSNSVAPVGDSTQTPSESDNEMTRKESPFQGRRSISHTADSGSLSPRNVHSPRRTPSFKDKAFVVRDVLIAKPESRNKAKGAGKSGFPPNIRKISTEASDLESEEELSDSIAKKRGLMKDSLNWKSKFAAAAIATYGAISTNNKVDVLPKENRRKFEEVKDEHALVIHDSIEVIERNRLQSVERKLNSLHVMTDVCKAIDKMRVDGKLNIETEEEKKARYSIECVWYKNLLLRLPQTIREDQDCSMVLDKIARFGSLEGRKISPAQFLKVLGLLRSWELCHPDISAAIEYVRDRIVEMNKSSFDEWFESKVGPRKRSCSAPP